MHPQHFGDSYDIVKQSLLAWLSADLGPWSAHPMFTDKVDDERATAFARFLVLLRYVATTLSGGSADHSRRSRQST